MRFCNYVTCAAILVAALLIPLKIQSSEVDTITDVKQSYSNAMETAIDDAMESAVESDHGDDVDLNNTSLTNFTTLFLLTLAVQTTQLNRMPLKHIFP